MKPKVYIAGKITDNENYKEEFEKVKEKMGERFTVLNPAELPEGMSKADYMRICFSMIDVADVVVFIEGWVRSEGAMLEHKYCEYIGKPIFYIWHESE